MSELQRLSQIATQLHQEEAEVTPPAVPFHARNGYHLIRSHEEWGYVCNDNGIGCGKPFPSREAKNEHRKWCLRAQV